MRLQKTMLCIFTALFLFASAYAQEKPKSPFFMRFKIDRPAGERLRVTSGGFRHEGGTSWGDWYLQPATTDIGGGVWSNWIDMTGYRWHGKLKRAGGIAEFPTIRLTVIKADTGVAVAGCSFDVQLADAPDERNIIVSFTEKGFANTIAFLAPYPLRENAKEFETGSQMTARHRKWAEEAVDGHPPVLKKFDIISSIWDQYDHDLEDEDVGTLKMLGFNVISTRPDLARKNGVRSYATTWLYEPDRDTIPQKWADTVRQLDRTSEDGKWLYDTMAHWVISDEVSGIDMINAPAAKVNVWFREYLRTQGVKDADLEKPIAEIEYPGKAMYEPTLPQTAPLPTRRLMYYAAKFGQWWSARQLRQTNDLIHGTFPNTKTQILLPSHGFLGNAWAAFNIGFSYRMLDIFEVGKQESVDQFSTEDWLGMNHMYWSDYTWTGGQTFGYLNALSRSAAAGHPIALRGLITPSDEPYLRLKAFTSLGQGAKSFFYWTYGPTFIGTENYWSDLRGMYDGIVKVNRDLEKSEDVLFSATTVSDPVAIFYSVSHDLWNTNSSAPFVEKRLLWHALRHLQIQPDFIREEDAAAKLKNYKVLYIVDRCISRTASAAIDEWVRSGGILYLSAGAATRDEFNEPYSPAFARKIWGEDAAARLISEQHEYNERKDLPTIKPLTTATATIGDKSFTLPAIGSRLDIAENTGKFAVFADGKTAGAVVRYEKGQIIAVGFMPMLAYGQLANFKPSTMEEKWPAEPREIIKMALDNARIVPAAAANVPVVQTDLLTGPAGSAVVLANYTYQPINELTIDLRISKPFKQATSIEGKKVKVEILDKATGKIRLKLPLDLTDIVLLR